MSARAGITTLLSLVMIGLGVALLVRTLAAGGGEIGIILGVGFVVAGAGRIYLARRAT